MTNGVTLSLEDFRCRGERDGRPCKRLLLRYSVGVIKPGQRIEIKCRDCNCINVLEG